MQFTKGVLEGQGLHIVDLSTKCWKSKLFHRLEPPFVNPPNDKYFGQETFLSVLDVAKTQLKAVCAIIEPYISTDWNAEFGEIYSRTFTFRKHSLTAQRIHFFNKKIDYKNLYKLSSSLKKAYLGYTVIRPLQSFRVCDTALASPCTITKKQQDLVHCMVEFNPSLLGNDLKVKGMPFIQQDTTAGVCAKADLWMIARYFNKKYMTRRYRIPKLTEVATKTNTSGPPREGLYDQQIMDALQNIGLNPVLLPLKDLQNAIASIYSCIESELPVIAGIPDPAHVFVVIGHNYKKNRINAHLTSDFVESFIVHDDACGPYKKLKTSVEVVELSDEIKEPHGDDSRKRELFKIGEYEVDFLITLLPHRVHMYWDDALDHAEIWLKKIKEVVSGWSKKWFSPTKLWNEEDLENLIYRVYLRESKKFKSEILNINHRKRRSETIIKKYRSMEMPKYIWVVELARNKDLGTIYNRKICGEILLDSTGNRNLVDETLLAFTLDGISFIPNGFKKPDLIIVDKKRYSPLQRSTNKA